MPLHARFTIWSISLPFPAKQRGQMIQLRFFGEHEHTNLKDLLDNPVTLEKQNKLEQLKSTNPFFK